ncbi:MULTISPECIES: cytochrome c [unclassified Bradyrhizobium]|uniref:c-type cytochrome n=1 Tax=unclassified Bradyrhizobium TaxID=2631580 RepID=UPI0028E27F93|nr:MULTISPECIES: cytochrome c [unclassified Bradyrhizobium]
MHRNRLLQISVAILLAIAALFLIRLHNAHGAESPSSSVAAGHKLAEAWCTACHVIDARHGTAQGGAPDFVAVANMHSTTELSLKVFLQSSHANMPNIMMTPEQRGDLVDYILSLKRK